MKVFGQLERAQLEALSGDPTGLGLITGRVWNNTTTSDLKYYNGAVRVFANLDEIQTFTNKVLTGNTIANFTPDGVNTLTAPVGVNDTLALVDLAQTLSNKSFPTALYPHQTTPSAPAAGNILLYSKNDNKLYKQDSEGNEVEVGTGGAGVDVFHVEDFEVNNAADMSSGNNATFLGGGVLAGTLVDNTATQIAGSRSLQYTQAVGSLNDYVATPIFNIDRKEAGNTNGVSCFFTYTGNKDDIKVVVYDDTNDAVISSNLDLLSNPGNPTRFSTSFSVPSGVTELRFGFQVVVENAGAILVIDEIQLTSDPFRYKDLLIEEVIAYDGYSGVGSDSRLRFNNLKDNDSGRLISSVSSDSTIITFLEDNVKFNISASYIGVNSSEFIIEVRDAGGTLVRESRDSSASNGVCSPSLNGIAQKGWNVKVFSSQTPNNSLATNLVVNASKDSEHVVSPADFSTQIIRYDGFDSKTLSNFMKFSTRRYNKYGVGASDSSVLFSDDNSGSVTRITALENCYFNVTAAGEHTAANTISIHRYNSSNVLQESNKNEQNTGFNSAVTTALLRMDEGDYIEIFYNQPTTITDSESFWLQVLATPIEAKLLVATPQERVAVLSDVKSSGTNGGSAISGVQTRVLNTLSGDTDFVTLSSNQFTMPRGKYDISSEASSYRVDDNRAYIYSTTRGYLLTGPAVFNSTTYEVGATAPVDGIIEVTSESETFELRHFTNTAVAANGLGTAVGDGIGSEVYATVKIRKIK